MVDLLLDTIPSTFASNYKVDSATGSAMLVRGTCSSAPLLIAT
jgi:hypothetical protein